MNQMETNMQVVKRDGRREDVAFEKVQQRIHKQAEGLCVNAVKVAQGVLSRIVDGITTTELDNISSNLAYSWSTTHPDYAALAGRIALSNHQKNTPARFVDVIERLDAVRDRAGNLASMLDPEFVRVVRENADLIESRIVYDRDFNLDYFGFKTLEKAYLLRDTDRRIVERPQHLWMRVAVGLWSNDLDKAFETYDMMSQKLYTHATPTLFNAGTKRPQLSSCFLLAMNDDSIKGIYKTLEDCAMISQYGGGIGIHCSNVRAKGSLIRGTGGISNGLVPMLRVFNNTARYVDQCFHPDTLVYTEAGPKRIEDVAVTDKVLTSDGNYNSVMKPVRHNYKGKILEFTLKYGISSVLVTPQHPILALCNQKKGLNFSVIRNRIDKELVEVEYTDANDLRVDDFIAFPIPKYEKDILSITMDDCRFYGIMLGDGYISNELSGITLNKTTKTETRRFVETYLENHSITYYAYEDEENNTVRIKWTNTQPGFKFTKSQLYDLTNEKHMDTGFMHLPIAKIKQILHGLIETDGCIGTKEVTIELSSFNLIESIRYLLLRMGALCSGYNRDRVGNVSSYKDITTKKPTKVVRIPRIAEITEMFPESPASEYVSFLKHGDYVYSRIESISEHEFEGTLHDFEIDSVHDYTIAHLGLAHNGGGKRNGSFAIYLEPWHADISEFLELKKNTGSEEERARDLFYALWVPDLFMERVDANGDWTLFCPNEAPGLADVVGDEFKALYEKYEAEGRGRRTIKAQKLWFQILDSQIETGTPYLCYKDAANKKSNQQNLGVIKSSNLCSEIIEYSSPDETAVCNLGSMSLPAFVRDGAFDFKRFRDTVRVAVRNLNRVIDINYYPTQEARRSNMRHRPIGLGVQGLADVFAMLKMSWESEEAATLNRRIFAHMYYAALESSCEIAATEGTYETYVGSPAWKGKFQPQLWNIDPLQDEGLDWDTLFHHISRIGLRNSLLVSPMPTASTSQILGNCECIEPYATHIFTRRTLAGEFIIINKHLVAALIERGIWSPEVKDAIIGNNGSVSGLPMIPDDLQAIYKTVWEIKQKTLIDMAADRGPYVCQSQSLNLFMGDPDYRKLTSMHFYTWRKGLKTGIYYLRTRAVASAQKFTVEPVRVISAVPVKEEEGCLMCSS
jgi:ribonucleoside-diphosphate reductase alpha subunit